MFFLKKITALCPLLLQVLLMSVCGQEIITPPQDTTAFLNQTANFVCETNGGDSTIFIINGTKYTDLLQKQQNELKINRSYVNGKNTELYTLTIPARVEYNETTVQCVTGDFEQIPVNKSDNVTLMIQGPLSAVKNLETASSASSITVSWSAPFSLDVTGVDPDIWYSVLIYNVTDEESPTAVPCTDCHNLTQTHYIFSPDYPSSCHKYTFTVIPYNGVGEGERSQNVTGYTIHNHHPNIDIKITGIESSSSGCIVQFQVSGGVGSVCSITLHDDNAPAISVESLLEDGHFINYTLPEDRKYSTHFEIRNAARTWIITGTNFTTYDVQNVTAKGGSKIDVEEVKFINKSPALGCLVVLQSDDGSDIFKPLFRTAIEPTLTSVIIVPPSTYTMYVYDLEKNGRINEMPSYLPENTIHVTQKDGPPDEMHSTASKFLTRAELSKSGSAVHLTCEFADEYPKASCVLVYRKYNNTHLTVMEYDQSTEFPVAISVANIEDYTFVVFGKNDTELEEVVFSNDGVATVHQLLLVVLMLLLTMCYCA